MLLRWPKGARNLGKNWRNSSNFLFFVLFLVILGQVVLIVRLLVLIFLVIVFGDDIDLDRMDLYHFHLGFALRTGQDFAFLDFIFVDVDFSSAFRTPDHGENLLENG
jgi:hypothetical protein